MRESRTGTWFQSPEAYAFFASMPQLFETFVYAIINDVNNANGGSLRGVCVGYVTREKSKVKQFFTKRAIIMGGPALAGDATNEEVGELMKAVREQLKSEAIYIETRNFNDYSQWKGAFGRARFGYKKHLNFHVDCTDKEAMWERLSENRKRQIRRVRGLEG